MIPLIAVGIVIAGVWGVKNPFAGLIGYLAATIIQPGELFPLFNTLHVERILAAVVVISFFIHGGKLQFPPLTRSVLWFYGACIASIPLAFWIGNSIQSAKDFGKIIIFHLMITAIVDTRQRLRLFIVAFCLLVGYLAVSSAIAYFQGNFIFTMNVDRAAGLTSVANSPDTLGLTIATTLPLLSLFLTTESPILLRLLLCGCAGVSLLTLLLTGSRGSVLTLLLILAISIMKSRKRMIILPAVVIIGMTVWNILPQQYKVRYTSVNHLQHDESYQNRLISWEGGWHMFLHNPITGIGVGDYTFANGSIYWPGPRKRWLDAHSLYFKLIGELGLLGIWAFVGFLVRLIKTNGSVRRRMITSGTYPRWMTGLPVAVNYAIIGLMYCGYAYHDLYRNTWYMMAGIISALYLIVQKEQEGVDGQLTDSDGTEKTLSRSALNPPQGIVAVDA